MFNLFKTKDKYLDATQAKNLTIDSKPKVIQEEVKLMLGWIREQASKGEYSLRLSRWSDHWSWHMRARQYIYLIDSILALKELGYKVHQWSSGDFCIYWH